MSWSSAATEEVASLINATGALRDETVDSVNAIAGGLGLDDAVAEAGVCACGR
jgi:hypothetical protein